MGPVALTVSDLGRSLDFYRRAIGLEVLEAGGGSASLGAGGRTLVELVELPGASPARGGHAGLFHLALLVPERRQLAGWLAHALRERVPLTGLADHFVSEAIYLDDPDGHGIEIYADRPRERWEGRVAERMTTLPLDVEGLMESVSAADTEPFRGLPAGTTMGHVHLRVAEIASATAFYTEALGMDRMARMGASAVFLAFGGYHHHVGANTWRSAGGAQAPAGQASLRHFTLLLPDAGARADLEKRLERAGHPVVQDERGHWVLDPSGNRLRLEIEESQRS